jgi:hypothetical protein
MTESLFNTYLEIYVQKLGSCHKNIADNIRNMTATQKTTSNIWTFRLYVACATAASVGLSIALISIVKFFLFIYVLSLLIKGIFNVSAGNQAFALRLPKHTTHAVLFALAIFCVSLLWTTAQTAESVGSLAKYGKLLSIILLACTIRSRREAFYAITAFVGAQASKFPGRPRIWRRLSLQCSPATLIRGL